MKKNILLLFFLVIGSWGFSHGNNCSFGLEVTSTQAFAGGIVDVEITTRQFNDILGMQYTHQWNPSELQFVDIIYNPAAGMNINDANFGLSEESTAGGQLTFVFVDPQVQGITVPDNTTLYTLRFVYLQSTEALIQINESLTQIEFADASSLLTNTGIGNYYLITGSVTPLNGDLLSYPSLNSSCLVSSSCEQGIGGQINIDAEGDDLLINWTGPNGFAETSPEIEGLAVGQYSLELTQENEQSIYVDFYLNTTNGLNLSFVVDHDQCGLPGDGAITATVSGGSGNYTYAWSNGESTSGLSNLSGGDYSLTVTDNDTDCSISRITEVETIVSLWVVDQSTPASCATSNDGSVDISVDGPADYAPFTYEWSNGATTEDLDQVASGFYTVTITTANNCSSFYAVFVEIDEPIFDITITAANCQNELDGSIELDIDETSFSVLWSTGATSSSISGLLPGIYGVSLTDLSNSCVYQYEYTVENLAELPVFYDVICNGDNAEIQLLSWVDIDAPYTIDWSTGEQTTLNFPGNTSIIVPQNGVYAVTITGASGCAHFIEDIVVDCNHDNLINLSLSPVLSSADAGETVCLDVRAEGFVDQQALQFTIEWDESLLSFTELNNINLPEFNNANYAIPLVDDGFLTVVWSDSGAGSGVSLSPSIALFTVCFEVVSGQEVATVVSFENFPTPIEFVNNDQIVETVITQDANITLNGGDVVFEDELNLSIGQVETTQGNTVCVPVKSSSFHGLGGLQFSIEWDAEALLFNSVQNVNLSDANFNTIAEGQLDGVFRFLWYPLSGEGVYISDNTTLLEICFTAQGGQGVYPVSFIEEIIPAIAATEIAEQVELNLTNGSVTIGEQTGNGIFEMSIATAAVDIGESVCLPVYADQLNGVLGMQFSINWDNELIDFNEVIILSDLLGLTTSSFGFPEEGVLTFLWNSPISVSASIPLGEALFELCFTANQQEGIAGINFSNTPTAIEFIDENIDVASFIPTNGQLTISSGGLIWPGDTDTNTEVNHFDLLNIGLAYGIQGPARNNASTNWLAQYTQPWEQSTPLSNIDYRFVDADGNGEINENDVQVIIQNWDETTEEYTSSNGTSRELASEMVPIYVQAATVEAGASVSLPIILGTDIDIAEDVYGIAFSIYYDPELVRPESPQINFEGWLGAESDDLLSVYRDYHGFGRIDVAMVRKDGQNITGHGQIGSFSIIMEDVILRGLIDIELPISIENVRLINAEEEEILTSPIETIVVIQNITATNEPFELKGLQVSPNPTKASFSVLQPNIAIRNITVFNAKGQLQQTLKTDTEVYNIEHLAAGVYWLKFQTDKGLAIRKLIKL